MNSYWLDARPGRAAERPGEKRRGVDGLLVSVIGDRVALMFAGTRWIRRAQPGEYLSLVFALRDVSEVAIDDVLSRDERTLRGSERQYEARASFPHRGLGSQRPAAVGLRLARLMVRALVALGEREGIGPPPIRPAGTRITGLQPWTPLALTPSSPAPVAGVVPWQWDTPADSTRDDALAAWAATILGGRPGTYLALAPTGGTARLRGRRDTMLGAVGTVEQLPVPAELARTVEAWLIVPS